MCSTALFCLHVLFTFVKFKGKFVFRNYEQLNDNDLCGRQLTSFLRDIQGCCCFCVCLESSEVLKRRRILCCYICISKRHISVAYVLVRVSF